MRIQFWGVRGSIPAPLLPGDIRDKIICALQGAQDVDLGSRQAIQEYVSGLPPFVQGTVGGNTSCVSIEVGDQWLIIDAGSGIRNLGMELMEREFGSGQGTAHILISHTHWDHIQGFPFFRPLFVPGNQIIIYSPIPDIERRLQHQQIPDYFPKRIPEVLRADLSFVQLPQEVPTTIAGVQVRSIVQSHPGQSYGYRLDSQGTSLVYASDAEYKDLDQAHTQQYVDFYQDADVLIFDAQYTLGDAFERVDWGHSSSMIGVDMAVRANVKRLLLFHYEHVYSDAQIQELLDSARQYVASDPTRPRCQVELAIEGMAFEMEQQDRATLSQRAIGDAVVLSIGGRLDDTAVHQVDERLNALISNGLKAGLVVDLSEMTHLSVAGLKTLLNAQRSSKGAPLVVAAAHENVRKVLAQVHIGRSAHSTPADKASSNGGPLAEPALLYYGTVREAVSALEARQYLELEGEVLLERYRVEGTLDISTKAGVFKAFDTWLERPVTIKVLSKTIGSHTDRILLDEARTLARLDHTNIVSVYDCVKGQNHLYLVREYIEGETLDSWRERLGHREPLSPEKVVAIARDILRGLAYAHEHGVIHRYIHPQNVILASSSAQAKLMNFGLADRPEEAWTLNQVAYMSPEQLAHQEPTASTDLYSLGVLLYELLTGRLPCGADTVKRLIEQCIYTPPIPPREIRAEIPTGLERIVLQLLNKDAESRPPSANAALHELESVEFEENPANRSTRHKVATARNRSRR